MDWLVWGIFAYTAIGVGVMVGTWYVTYRRQFDKWR